MPHGWSLADLPDLAGKRVLITGGTGGIGLEAAAGLAGAGAEVLVTGRSEPKGEAALAAIRARHPAARVGFALADQASLAALAGFADALLAADEPLDILIDNAGVLGKPVRETTLDGFEATFGINHLGHFALAARLLPLLLAAPAPRLVTVASIAHAGGRIAFDDLQSEHDYRMVRAYRQSKLANLMFALELARHSAAGSARLASIAAHPGFASTGLFHSSLRARLARLVMPFIGHSAAAGALPLLYAATAPQAVNGGYYGPDRLGEMVGAPAPARVARQAQDRAAAERLWAISEALTGVRVPAL